MKISYLSFLLIALLGFTACGGDDDGPITPPKTSANILGSVNLFDEGVTQIDNSNMTVKIEGTGISATTNTNGDFILSDVPFGTYTLIYEKSGYGVFKKFGIEHKNTGSSTVISESPSLGQKSTTSITNLAVTSSSNFPVVISASTDPPANNADQRYIRYFFSTEPTVSSENYENALETVQVAISPDNFNLSQAALDALGYTSGMTVYVKCYGESFYGNNYSDPNLGRDVFPNLNMTSADAVSFEVP